MYLKFQVNIKTGEKITVKVVLAKVEKIFFQQNHKKGSTYCTGAPEHMWTCGLVQNHILGQILENIIFAGVSDELTCAK